MPIEAHAEAARVLAHAFRDNPLNQAVVKKGPRKRIRSNYYGMRALLDTAHGRALSWCLRADPGTGKRAPIPVRGVLIAAAPGYYPLPAPSVWHQLRFLWGQSIGIRRRWAEVFHALEALHPVEQHWYLALLGVDPDHQGGGFGSAMLRRFAERVDQDAVPAYLETDRAENVAFYGQVGFDVVHEVEVLGVRVWCMKRPVR